MIRTQLIKAISRAQTERTGISKTLPDLYSRLSRLRGFHDRCLGTFGRYRTNVSGFESAQNKASGIPNMRIATWCSRCLSKDLTGGQRTGADDACVSIPQKIENEIARVENEIRMIENRVSTLDGQIRMWQIQLSNLAI